jgi:hypothetical protein
MPFDPLQFSAFIADDSTTLWFYDTDDLRADVLAFGYFAPVAGQLRDGDVIICHADDALMFLPVFAGAVVGAGLVLDTYVPLLRLTASADQRIGSTQSIPIILRLITLGPVPNNVLQGRNLTVQAFVTGPASNVTFRLVTAANATVATQVSPLAGGVATATFPMTDLGSFRIRASITEDTAAAIRSAIFTVTEPFSLLLENGSGSLLTEARDEILI